MTIIVNMLNPVLIEQSGGRSQEMLLMLLRRLCGKSLVHSGEIRPAVFQLLYEQTVGINRRSVYAVVYSWRELMGKACSEGVKQQKGCYEIKG